MLQILLDHWYEVTFHWFPIGIYFGLAVREAGWYRVTNGSTNLAHADLFLRWRAVTSFGRMVYPRAGCLSQYWLGRQPPLFRRGCVRLLLSIWFSNYALHVLSMPCLARLSLRPHWHVVYTLSFAGNISNQPCTFLPRHVFPNKEVARHWGSRCRKDRHF